MWFSDNQGEDCHCGGRFHWESQHPHYWNIEWELRTDNDDCWYGVLDRTPIMTGCPMCIVVRGRLYLTYFIKPFISVELFHFRTFKTLVCNLNLDLCKTLYSIYVFYCTYILLSCVVLLGVTARVITRERSWNGIVSMVRWFCYSVVLELFWE